MLSGKEYEDLSKFKLGEVRNSNGASPEVEYLVTLGFLSATSVDSLANNGAIQVFDSAWVLTDAGKHALSEFESVSQEKAEQKRQQRFQNKVSVASILVPAITFVIGLLVEHFSNVVGIIFGLL